jgi:arsenite methyltransferase
MGLRDTFGVAFKRFLYEGSGRDQWQQPERVLGALDLQPGDVVADLGSGTGYFTLRLARAVGPTGRVFAVDTDGQLLAAIERSAGEEGLSNVAPVRASDGALTLPSRVDVVFLSNVYHHLPEQAAYFGAARSQLAPGGRVAILESRPEGGLFARLFGHATDPAAIRHTMSDAGYELVASHDFIDRRSFQIFEPIREASGAAATD